MRLLAAVFVLAILTAIAPPKASKPTSLPETTPPPVSRYGCAKTWNASIRVEVEVEHLFVRATYTAQWNDLPESGWLSDNEFPRINQLPIWPGDPITINYSRALDRAWQFGFLELHRANGDRCEIATPWFDIPPQGP